MFLTSIFYETKMFAQITWQNHPKYVSYSILEGVIENLKQCLYLKCLYLKMGSHGNTLAVSIFSGCSYLSVYSSKLRHFLVITVEKYAKVCQNLLKFGLINHTGAGAKVRDVQNWNWAGNIQIPIPVRDWKKTVLEVILLNTGCDLVIFQIDLP